MYSKKWQHEIIHFISILRVSCAIQSEHYCYWLFSHICSSALKFEHMIFPLEIKLLGFIHTVKLESENVISKFTKHTHTNTVLIQSIHTSC